ncbi:MAG: glycosyltransferase family 2 protein [Candidatus Jordarchaeaceae archaeon]
MKNLLGMLNFPEIFNWSWTFGLSWLTLLVYFILGIILAIVPLIYLFTAFASLLRREKKTLNEKKHFPTVTIFVPTYNEEKNVERILNSLNNLNYPKDKIEFVFVDDSTDDTFKIIEEKTKNWKNAKRIKHKKRLTKAYGLNEALSISKGEIVVVYDADCSVNPDSIKNLVKHFDKPEVVAVQGRYEAERLNTLSRIIDLEYTLWQGGQLVATPVLIGYNYAVRRSYLEKTGGWDPEMLAEDHELWYRIYADGYKIVYTDKPGVKVLEPPTLKDFVRQRRRWSRGSDQATAKYSHLRLKMFPKPRIPNFLSFSARYIAPSLNAVCLALLPVTLAIGLIYHEVLPLLILFLGTCFLISLAALIFCIRLGKIRAWLYFVPLSFLVLYQNILFFRVRKKEVTWEKTQK